jgi:signal transduction histidine kinase/CheY-like chemotaxis protein
MGTSAAMKLWGKEAETAGAASGATGLPTSRQEQMTEVLRALSRERGVDRAGVWLEGGEEEEPAKHGRMRGVLWDRAEPETPAGWNQLSPEDALPGEMLRAPRIIEQDIEGSAKQVIFGPLVELRRALWVPIGTAERLRGVLLVGSRSKGAALPRLRATELASWLAMALQAAEQERLAARHLADLDVMRNTLEALSAGEPPDQLLLKLLDTFSEAPGTKGLGTRFAALGLAGAGRASDGENAVTFPWQSGDPNALRGLQTPPVAGVWRKALREQRVSGADAQFSWDRGGGLRVVAVPVKRGGKTAAVLVAGLPRAKASLATLERIEFRAAVAAAILERKRAAERDAEETALQQALLESPSEAAVLLESDGTLAGISRAARDILGQGTPGQPFAAMFPKQEQRKVAAWLERIAAAGAVMGRAALDAELRENCHVRLNWVSLGGAFPAVFLEPLPIPTGAANGAGERADSELRTVIEWLEEGVVLFDAENRVRAANSRFEQMAGLTHEESGKYGTLEALIGALAGRAAEPEAFAARWRELGHGLEGGVREELQMLQPMPRVLERSARPVVDGAGRLLGRVEIYRDLTAQRIFQSKLLHTEKLAALGQMTTGVAHELSNPLTTILGYAQRLMMRNDAAGRSEEARHILEEAERAGRILRQLLSSARETPPERRSIGLNQIVRRVLDLQSFGLEAAGIRLELDLDPLLPNIRGDAGRFQQVVMNLVGNARQALEQQGRGGTLRIRTWQVADSRVALDVVDDGPGIPPAVLPRIFDPFFTTKPAGEGTGLGLAIVLNIVREHGGQVSVTTPAGGGAAFHIELPAIATEHRGSAAERSGEELAGVPGPAARRATEGPHEEPAERARLAASKAKRVLVVEDEPTVARLISDVLRDEGFAVEVLLDGRAALDRSREAFDLVICDMKMPGLDGQHFYKSLARMGSPLRDRFLFVTGDVIGPQTRAFLQQHQLPHLSKPFRVEELTAKVRAVLAVQASAGGAALAARKNAARNG